MSRTKKKPYTKSKAIDKQCRNHGKCPYCQANRKYKYDKLKEDINKLLEDYIYGKEIILTPIPKELQKEYEIKYKVGCT